ncbi:hypothetical protein TL16_g01335 [Triparma laevis f. inornata]|uniref:non-specific serine/threonine protein kinase n=2 Tax=Triparma laevis f. inornata TaxID=1714386 RepID=A0A9W6ZLX3_9STRA|nr:hypothetical protein TL16_g01335 [Triparma laevis f. inornata]
MTNRRRGSRQMSNPPSPRGGVGVSKLARASTRFTLDNTRQLDCGPLDPTKYETLKHIGRGAFGSVHLIKSRKENNLFALKTMSYGDAEIRTHVSKEIQLLIKLMHPFVIGLYDLYTEGESGKAQTMNLVMTYCDGGDLSKLIKAERKNLDSMDAIQHKDSKLYSPQNFLRWFCMTCLSLDYLHSNKILHRDIKPDNIFLSASSKNCRLGDFGLAKVLDSDEDVVKTEVGTTYYISPEIISNKGYSYPTDVWSLGCVLYELVTLSLPYYGDNLTEFVNALMVAEDKDLRHQDEQILKVPEEIWNIILRMLDKDPSHRITVKEILNSRIMKKVCKSVIDKHKPSNMNNREVREEQTGLTNQVDDIWREWEESHPPELAQEESSPRNSSPLQELKTENLEEENPDLIMELVEEHARTNVVGARAFLPTIDSDRKIDGITPIIENMNEEMQSPVKMIDRKYYDSPVSERSGGDSDRVVGEFRFSDASPHSRSVLANVAHEITNNVIEQVLQSPLQGKYGDRKSPRSIPPPLEKQTSNMSVVSTTSAENEARTPINEGRSSLTLTGARVGGGMTMSASTSSLKATERLEKALEYGEEVEKTVEQAIDDGGNEEED